MTQTLGTERLANDLRDTSSLLGSRVCHDLISPMGAISNGLELLTMAGLPQSPELRLIEESIDNANARLKFFRVAFGASSGGQMLARTEVLKLLDGVYGGGRMKVKWDSLSDPTRTEAKLAFLAILCMESTLPQGGQIGVGSERGEWQFHSYGPKIKYDADTWAAVKAKGAGHPGSSEVHFALLGEALAEVRRPAQVGHSDSAVSLRY